MFYFLKNIRRSKLLRFEIPTNGKPFQLINADIILNG